MTFLVEFPTDENKIGVGLHLPMELDIKPTDTPHRMIDQK